MKHQTSVTKNKNMKIVIMGGTVLKANHDPRTVITDEQATYFGIPLNHRSLVPDKNQLLGPTHFEAWLRRSTQKP
jgi:hypothetical protein